MASRLGQHLDAVGLQLPEAKAEPGMGSTDWANVSYEVPSVETSFPILDRVCTWHSQEVVEAADSEMGYANTLAVARAMALTGIDLIVDRTCWRRSRTSSRARRRAAAPDPPFRLRSGREAIAVSDGVPARSCAGSDGSSTPPGDEFQPQRLAGKDAEAPFRRAPAAG